ncbi:hypothetical protein [Nannocystis pusilla]|uniref:hypothetical protein n=1 Tax=Nannocystis pusilla TaxID=889268 RepID=UPI003DA54E9E
MSNLLKLEVLERTDRRLVLRARLLPTEQGQFCTSREFAWMLVDPFQNEHEFRQLDRSALRAVSDAYDAIDEVNMSSPARKRLQHCLVESVSVTDAVNYTEERRRDLWEAAPDAAAEEALYPQATYRIELADPRLCGHLPVGFTWKSTAYDEFHTGEFLPYPAV